MHIRRTVVFSSSFLLGLTALSSSSLAQTQEGTASPETTFEENSTYATDSDSDEDDDSTTTQSWTPSWSSSGGWPRYEYVSCTPHGGMHGGGWTGMMPHFPGGTMDASPMPGMTTDIRCNIQNRGGYDVFYDCNCGGNTRPRGQLVGSWFRDRPGHDAREAGCKELLTAQCGNTRVAAQTSCSNSYGHCSAAVMVRDDVMPFTALSFSCQCIDSHTWSSDKRISIANAPNVVQLNDRCQSEIAKCGTGTIGEAGSQLLVDSDVAGLNVRCGSAFGACDLSYRSSGQDQLSCNCRGGERKVLNGDLGWGSSNAGELLQQCAQEIDQCKPQGSAGLDSAETMPAAGGTGASSSASNATSTQGGGAGAADTAPQINCALSGGEGRLGDTLLGCLALLGWRRRSR